MVGERLVVCMAENWSGEARIRVWNNKEEEEVVCCCRVDEDEVVMLNR